MDLAAGLATAYATINPKPETLTLWHQAGETSETIEDAYRAPVKQKEASASGGIYTTKDVKWMLGTASVVSEVLPQPGDKLTDADDVAWNIVGVDRFLVGTMLRCWARKAALDSILDHVCDIEFATVSADESLGPIYRWAAIATDVPCHFHPMDVTETTETMQTKIFAKYAVTVGLDIAAMAGANLGKGFDSSYRLVWNGQAYRVVRRVGMEQLGGFPVVEVAADDGGT